MKLSRCVPFAFTAGLLASAAHGAVAFTNYMANGDSNYAPGGVASQTTTGYSAPASRANDGIATQGFGGNTTTHTDDSFTGLNNWQVDLLTAREVNQIKLTNRGDGINNRLSNFRLQVLNSTLTEVWGQDYYTAGGNVGDSEVFGLPAGISGQFVRVQQLGLNAGGNNILSLAEVEVIDQKSAAFPNVALGATASQSSTGYGGVASRANDGNRDGNFSNNSVTHTDDGQPAGAPVWLKLDLGGDFQINEISLWNRTDCCWGRLGNFRLSVRDNGVEVWGHDFAASDPLTAKGMLSAQDDAGGFFVTGDEVRVDLINGLDATGFNNIHLAEFEVFGVAAIPEPATLSTLALAGLATLRRRRK
jgi:hypothetical protein